MTPNEQAREASDRDARDRLGLGERSERRYVEPVAKRHLAPKMQPCERNLGFAAPETLAVPRFRPIGVYVARKPFFHARVRNAGLETDVITEAFRELPLEQHGWDVATSRARHLTSDLWQVSRA